jgi:hypothetical protein
MKLNWETLGIPGDGGLVIVSHSEEVEDIAGTVPGNSPSQLPRGSQDVASSAAEDEEEEEEEEEEEVGIEDGVAEDDVKR